LKKPKRPRLLPNPIDLSYFIEEKTETAEFNQFLTVLNNPKLNALNFIQTSLGEKVIGERAAALMLNPGYLNEKYNMPFLVFYQRDFKIASDKQLQWQNNENRFLGYDEEILRKRILSLEKLLSKFKEQDIEVVIFTTPHHIHYLDTISSSDKERFLEIISGIATEKKIPLHYFHERYKNAPIFSNGSHVAFHERGLIYSDDMIKVIKQELGL